ncbi:MAG: hypothetical protein SGPRY_014108 [Prymnesium sp.]
MHLKELRARVSTDLIPPTPLLVTLLSLRSRLAGSILHHFSLQILLLARAPHRLTRFLRPRITILKPLTFTNLAAKPHLQLHTLLLEVGVAVGARGGRGEAPPLVCLSQRQPRKPWQLVALPFELRGEGDGVVRGPTPNKRVVGESTRIESQLEFAIQNRQHL